MFTETYIEMVSNADEIQALCKYKKGDWFRIGDGKKSVLWVIDEDDRDFYYKTYFEDYKVNDWLPTLEDLFGIAKPIFSRTALELNYVVIGDKVEVLIGKCDSEGCGLDIEFTATSLETGLLRAIMAYEYNKSWNGKVWEERNGS